MQKFRLMRWAIGMHERTVSIRGHVDLTARYRDDEIWKAFAKEVDDEWE